MTPAPDSTPAFSLPPGETPLGIQHPLGLSLLQPKFLTPLGAQPLTVLNPSTFSSLREAELSDIAAPFQDSPFFDAPSPVSPPKPAAARPAVPSVQAAPITNTPRNQAPTIVDIPAEVAAPAELVPDQDASPETPEWEGEPDVEAIAPPDASPAIQAFPESSAPAIAPPDSTPAIQAFSDSPVPVPTSPDPPGGSDAIAPPPPASTPVSQAFSEAPVPSPAIAPATSAQPAPAIQAFSDRPVPLPTSAAPPGGSDAIASPPPDSTPAIQAFSEAPVPSPAIARFPEPDTTADAAAPEPTRLISDPAEVSSTVDPSITPVSTATPVTDPPAPPAIPAVTPAAASPAIAPAPLPEPETRQAQPPDLSQTAAALSPDVTPAPQPATVPDRSDPLPDRSPALEPAAVEVDSALDSPTREIEPLNSAAASPVAVESAPPSVQAAAIAQPPPTESAAISESPLTGAIDAPEVEPATAPAPAMAVEPESDLLPMAERAEAPAAVDESVMAEPERDLDRATSPSEPSLQLKADPAPAVVSPFSDIESSLPASPGLELNSPLVESAAAAPTESAVSSEDVLQRSPAATAAPNQSPRTELSETVSPSTQPLEEVSAAAPDGISQVEPTRTTIQPDLLQTPADVSPPTLQRTEVSPELDADGGPTLQRADVSPESDPDGGAIATIQPRSLPEPDRTVPVEPSAAQPSEVTEPATIALEPSANSPPSEATIQPAALPQLEAIASFPSTPTAETADRSSAPPQVQAFQEPEASLEIADADPDSADIAVADPSPELQAQAELPAASSSPVLESATSRPTGDFNVPAMVPERPAPELSLGAANLGDDQARIPAPTPEPVAAVEMPTIQPAALPTDPAAPVSDARPVNPAPELATAATETPTDGSSSTPPIPELPRVIQRLSVWEPLVQAQPLGAEVSLFQTPVIQRAPAPEPSTSQSGGSDRNPPPGRSDSAPKGYQVPELTSSGASTPDSWSSIAELLSASGASGSSGSTASPANSSGSSTPDSWSSIAELATFNSPASEVPAIAPSSGYSELQLYPESSSTPDLQASPVDTIQRNQASPAAVPAAPPEPATQSAGASAQAANASPEALEKLALEIYRLVLQRLALERERLGHTNSGRLPW